MTSKAKFTINCVYHFQFEQAKQELDMLRDLEEWTTWHKPTHSKCRELIGKMDAIISRGFESFKHNPVTSTDLLGASRQAREFINSMTYMIE